MISKRLETGALTCAVRITRRGAAGVLAQADAADQARRRVRGGGTGLTPAATVLIDAFPTEGPTEAVNVDHEEAPTVGTAAAASLARADLAVQSRRSCAQTLTRIMADVGDHQLVALDSERARCRATGSVERMRAGHLNRHVATARSFVAFCQRYGWLGADVALRVDRPREPADRSRAIAYAQLERLWRREDVAVREKALWRLLYETAARASEILSLNVEDIDRDNRRAVVRSKGGDIDLLHFQAGSARLIPRLIGDRPRGPLFLADRQPAPGHAPALVDICPFTDRARLSYRSAEEIIRKASGGWTLHQVRRSAITHLAEDNVALPMLMAKSGHTSLRSLQKYARPSADGVAALTAAHDPERRRR